MTDLTFIKENNGKVLVAPENKIYQYSKITNSWVTVGLCNEKSISKKNTIIGLSAEYDSLFDPLQNAIIAQLVLFSTDSDGNNITWSSSSSDPIVEVTGNSPEFSFVPRKSEGDDEKSAIITFNGVINPTGVDSCPKFKEVNVTPIIDSGFTADSLGFGRDHISNLELKFLYNWETADLIEFNHERVIPMCNFTVPLIQYLASKDTKSSSDRYSDLKFNPNGTMIFLLDVGGNELLSYNLDIAYDISTIDHATEKTLNLKNNTWNSNDASTFSFSYNGLKLFVIDKTLNQIAEYWLTTAYDLHTGIRKDNFKNHFSKLNNQADGFISSDGKYYYTLVKPSIAAQTGSYYYNQSNQVITGGVINRYSLEDTGQIYSLSVDSSDTIITETVPGYERIFEEKLPGSFYGYFKANGLNGAYYWNRVTQGIISFNPYEFGTINETYARYNHHGLPQSICFNSSGTRMIIGETIAATHGRFVEYRLSTPWDPSSRDNPENKYGTNKWTSQSGGPSIGQTRTGFPNGMHEIGTPTASEKFEEPSFNFPNTRLPHGPESIRLSPDGSKFYVLTKNTNIIYQYNIPAPLADSEYSIYNLPTPIVTGSKDFAAGGYDLRILLNTLDSANSRLGNDLDTFHSINIIDSNKMFLSGNRYIHTIELNSFDLVSNLLKSDSNSSMTSTNNISSVNTFNDRLYVHNETGIISQWKMNTPNDPNTAVREHTKKIITFDSDIGPGGLEIDFTDSISTKFYIGGHDIYEIQKYNYDSGIEGMTRDSVWNYSLDSSSANIPIAGITGMSFADSNGRLNVSSTNRIFQINLDDTLLHNSTVDSNSYGVASPASAEAHGISWWPGGDKFNITGRTSSANSTVQTFETKNSYSVKSV